MDIEPDNLASLATPHGHREPAEARCRRSCSAPTRCRRSTWPRLLDLRGRRGARRPRRRHPGRPTERSRCSTTRPTKRDAGARPQDITDQVSCDLSGVIANGTGTGAEFGQPAAGKTGTTQDNRDAWFVGYTLHAHRRRCGTGSSTTARWTTSAARSVSAARYPAPIWGSSWPRPPRARRAVRTTGRRTCPDGGRHHQRTGSSARRGRPRPPTRRARPPREPRPTRRTTHGSRRPRPLADPATTPPPSRRSDA